MKVSIALLERGANMIKRAKAGTAVIAISIFVFLITLIADLSAGAPNLDVAFNYAGDSSLLLATIAYYLSVVGIIVGSILIRQKNLGYIMMGLGQIALNTDPKDPNSSAQQ